MVARCTHSIHLLVIQSRALRLPLTVDKKIWVRENELIIVVCNINTYRVARLYYVAAFKGVNFLYGVIQQSPLCDMQISSK